MKQTARKSEKKEETGSLVKFWIKPHLKATLPLGLSINFYYILRLLEMDILSLATKITLSDTTSNKSPITIC